MDDITAYTYSQSMTPNGVRFIAYITIRQLVRLFIYLLLLFECVLGGERGVRGDDVFVQDDEVVVQRFQHGLNGA